MPCMHWTVWLPQFSYRTFLYSISCSTDILATYALADFIFADISGSVLLDFCSCMLHGCSSAVEPHCSKTLGISTLAPVRFCRYSCHFLCHTASLHMALLADFTVKLQSQDGTPLLSDISRVLLHLWVKLNTFISAWVSLVESFCLAVKQHVWTEFSRLSRCYDHCSLESASWGIWLFPDLLILQQDTNSAAVYNICCGNSFYDFHLRLHWNWLF